MISRAGTARSPSGKSISLTVSPPMDWKLLKKRAKVMMMTIFISSEGWTLNNPRFSQRVAPMELRPTTSTATSRIRTNP